MFENIRLFFSRLFKIFAKPDKIVYKDGWRMRGKIVGSIQAAWAYAPTETMTMYIIQWDDGTSEHVAAHTFVWDYYIKAYIKS
jgi:hypothetical protein